MKNVIENLKKSIEAHTAVKRELRAEINALKWVPGPLPAVQRDEQGRRTTGKKARTPFRRPETGMERCAMHASYQFPDRARARAAHIAYGLLRGVPYEVMEPKSLDKPNVNMVLRAIHDAVGDDKTLLAEWPLSRIQSLLERGSGG